MMRKAAREPVRRRQRALDGDRFQLKAPPIPGYRTRWINDTKNRIYQFTVEDDWDFVLRSEIPTPKGLVGDPSTTPEQDLGAKVAKIVGYEGGNPIHAYLCKKRLEYWKADQLEKKQKQDEVMSELKKGHPYLENREGSVEVA